MNITILQRDERENKRSIVYSLENDRYIVKVHLQTPVKNFDTYVRRLSCSNEIQI